MVLKPARTLEACLWQRLLDRFSNRSTITPRVKTLSKDNAMPGFCTNCGAPLAGVFCGRCGQRAQSASAPQEQPQPSFATPQPEPPVTSPQPAAAMPQPTVAAQPTAAAP